MVIATHQDLFKFYQAFFHCSSRQFTLFTELTYQRWAIPLRNCGILRVEHRKCETDQGYRWLTQTHSHFQFFPTRKFLRKKFLFHHTRSTPHWSVARSRNESKAAAGSQNIGTGFLLEKARHRRFAFLKLIRSTHI